MQNSGEPGSGISIRVRGPASLNAGNQPLYVVDGVPMIQGSLEPDRAERTGRHGDHRPQSRRDRDDRRPQGRGGGRDLRLARLERRRAHHDEARRGRQDAVLAQQLRRHAAGRAARSGCSTRSSTSSCTTRARRTTATRESYDFTPGVDDANSYDWQGAVFRRAPVSDVQPLDERRQRASEVLSLRIELRPAGHRHRVGLRSPGWPPQSRRDRHGQVLPVQRPSVSPARTTTASRATRASTASSRTQSACSRSVRSSAAAMATAATAKDSSTRTPSRSPTSTSIRSRRCARSATLSGRYLFSAEILAQRARRCRRVRHRRAHVGRSPGRRHLCRQRQRRRPYGVDTRTPSTWPRATPRSSHSARRPTGSASLVARAWSTTIAT